jgi:hypothetical protein
MRNNLSHINLLLEFKLDLGDGYKYLQMGLEAYLELINKYSCS